MGGRRPELPGNPMALVLATVARQWDGAPRLCPSRQQRALQQRMISGHHRPPRRGRHPDWFSVPLRNVIPSCLDQGEATWTEYNSSKVHRSIVQIAAGPGQLTSAARRRGCLDPPRGRRSKRPPHPGSHPARAYQPPQFVSSLLRFCCHASPPALSPSLCCAIFFHLHARSFHPTAASCAACCICASPPPLFLAMAFVPTAAAPGRGAPRRAAVGERRPVLRVGGHALQRARGGGRVGRPAPPPAPRMTAAKQASPAQAEARDVDYLPAQQPTKHGALGVGGGVPFVGARVGPTRAVVGARGACVVFLFLLCWRSRRSRSGATRPTSQ